MDKFMEKTERILIKVLFFCGIVLVFNWLFVWPAPRQVHELTEDEIWEYEHRQYLAQNPEETVYEEEEVIEKKVESKKSETRKEEKKKSDKKKRRTKTKHSVTATIYNATKKQCDKDPDHPADPNVTINHRKLNAGKIKWIAISPDLQKHYDFGDKVRLICKSDPRLNGIYEVHDLTNSRFRKRIDILFPTKKNKDFPQGVWDVTIQLV